MTKFIGKLTGKLNDSDWCTSFDTIGHEKAFWLFIIVIQPLCSIAVNAIVTALGWK